MKPFLAIALTAVVGLFAAFGLAAVTAGIVYHIVNTDEDCGPDCPCVVSPFSNSQAPGCQPGSPFCPPGQPACPGGQCPTGSIEVGDTNGEVNREALEETKDGQPCPSCPLRPTAAATKSPVNLASKAIAGDEAKEGVFACWRCKQKTVGQEWHELWADDGTSLTCMCQRCWRSSNLAEKRAVLEAFAKESKLSSSQQFYVEAAIGEALR